MHAHARTHAPAFAHAHAHAHAQSHTYDNISLTNTPSKTTNNDDLASLELPCCFAENVVGLDGTFSVKQHGCPRLAKSSPTPS